MFAYTALRENAVLRKIRTKKKENGKPMEAELDTACFSRVSSLERRIWSVFFTIFKHQNLTGSKYAWCWFAQQLSKLDRYLQTTNNENSRKMLKSWMEALNLDVQSVVSEYASLCSFNSSMCGGCSAVALGAPDKNTTQLPAALHKVPQFSRETLSDDSKKAVLRSYNTEEGATVQVNAAFTKIFGLRGEDLQKILEWSGGGFLPWGGDILAKIVVKETDLHIFLQILALKFKSLGQRKQISDEVIRQIPSTHVFDLWCADDDGVINSIEPFLLNSFHQETIKDHKEMTTEMRIEFQSVGPRMKATFGDNPVTLDNPQQEAEKKTQALKKFKIDEVTNVKSRVIKHEQQQDLYENEAEGDANNSFPSFTVDRIPSDLADIYDWSDDIIYAAGKDPNDVSTVHHGPPKSDSGADLQWLTYLIPADNTYNVLAP